MRPPKKCMKVEQVIDVLLNSQDESFSDDEDSNSKSPIKLPKTPIKSQIEKKSPPIKESITQKETITAKQITNDSSDSTDDEDDDDDDIPLALLVKMNGNKSINNTKNNETGIEGDVEDGNDEDSDESNDEDDIPLARLVAKKFETKPNSSNKNKNNKKSLLKGIFDFIDSESEEERENTKPNFNDRMSDKENSSNANKANRKSNSPLKSPVILFDNSNRFILSIKNLKRKKSSGLM